MPHGPPWVLTERLRLCDRWVVKLRVIGAGFGRTGTLSLKVALERLLGGRCYHMTEVLGNRDHVEVWADKGQGKDVDLDTVLGDFVAAVDWPTTRYYAELAEQNPEAKVVLTVRDPERWYESTRETIFELTAAVGVRPVCWLAAVTRLRRFRNMTSDIIWGPRGHFGGRFEDRDHAISVYQAHIEEVRERIPSDRLLEYEIKQGVGPVVRLPRAPGAQRADASHQRSRADAHEDPLDEEDRVAVSSADVSAQPVVWLGRRGRAQPMAARTLATASSIVASSWCRLVTSRTWRGGRPLAITPASRSRPSTCSVVSPIYGT